MKIKQILPAKKGFVNVYQMDNGLEEESPVILWAVVSDQAHDSRTMDKIVGMDEFSLSEMGGYQTPDEVQNFKGTRYLPIYDAEVQAEIERFRAKNEATLDDNRKEKTATAMEAVGYEHTSEFKQAVDGLDQATKDIILRQIEKIELMAFGEVLRG